MAQFSRYVNGDRPIFCDSPCAKTQQSPRFCYQNNKPQTVKSHKTLSKPSKSQKITSKLSEEELHIRNLIEKRRNLCFFPDFSPIHSIQSISSEKLTSNSNTTAQSYYEEKGIDRIFKVLQEIKRKGFKEMRESLRKLLIKAPGKSFVAVVDEWLSVKGVYCVDFEKGFLQKVAGTDDLQVLIGLNRIKEAWKLGKKGFEVAGMDEFDVVKLM